MLLDVFILRVKHASLTGIDHVSVQIFVVALVLAPVGHMHMAVKKKFWLVFLNQGPEHLKALMGEITPVVELIGGGVSYQDIKAVMAEKLEPEFGHPLSHLFFGVLVGARPVAHGTAKAQNSDAVIDEYLILDTGTSFWRNFFIFSVVVSVDIEHRDCGQCHKEGEVARIQIAAGDDQVDPVQLALFEEIPQIFRFFVCNCKYLHM